MGPNPSSRERRIVMQPSREGLSFPSRSQSMGPQGKDITTKGLKKRVESKGPQLELFRPQNIALLQAGAPVD